MEYVKAEIVIITALELERRAVVARLRKAQTVTVAGHVLDFGEIGRYRVTVRCLSGMGNVKSASATATALHLDHPEAVLLVGIAGGTNRPLSSAVPSGECTLGDVLVAERILEYELGKLKPGTVGDDGHQSQGTFEMRPREYPCSSLLLQAAKRIRSSEWAQSLQSTRPDRMSDRILPAVHFGTVASGQKVVTDDSFVDELRRTWRDLVGVEMEAVGVASAIHDDVRKVHFLMMKGICDWADPEKNDDWQPYAAESAAAFAEALLNARPIECELRSKDLVNTDSTPKAVSKPDLRNAVWRPSGRKKIEFCRRLIQGWRDLADLVEIPGHDIATFQQGNEARSIWEWLEQRGRLQDLSDGLQGIGRADLVAMLLEEDLRPDPT